MNNDNIVRITSIFGDDELAIEIERKSDPEFVKTAHGVSNYLNSLPLTADQNNRLIDLMCANVGAAERNAFRQGFGWGYEAGRYEDLSADDED